MIRTWCSASSRRPGGGLHAQAAVGEGHSLAEADLGGQSQRLLVALDRGRMVAGQRREPPEPAELLAGDRPQAELGGQAQTLAV